MLCHPRAPEKWHQPLAARFGRRGPVALVRARLLDFGIAVHRRSQHVEIEPAEDLLRSHAVEREEDDVIDWAARARRRRLRRRSRCQTGADNQKECSQRRPDRAAAEPLSLVFHGPPRIRVKKAYLVGQNGVGFCAAKTESVGR